MEGLVSERILCQTNSMNIVLVLPEGENLIDQIDHCIANCRILLQEKNYKYCIRQTYFINSDLKEDFTEIQQILYSKTLQILQTFIPINVVTQPPLGTQASIAAEYVFINDAYNIEHKIKENVDYLKLKTPYGTLISAAGLKGNLVNKNILQQSIEAFELIEKILIEENFTYGDIIRQWNYIERIIDYSEGNQHYQIFNDVRTSYYSRSEFPNGYPSATGIGMSSNGVSIDFWALKPSSDVKIIPLENPLQTNAHQYSSHVLAPSQLSLISCVQSTPKFERGKIIYHSNSSIVLVSGTAAIKGERSASQLNAATQTELTLENIAHLLSEDNLVRHGIDKKNKITPIGLRVYIKNFEDFEIVKTIITNKLPTVPVLYLQADICRSELLVEIEEICVMCIE